MLKFILIALSITLTFVVRAQDTQIDSLKRLIAKSKEDTTKINLMMDLGTMLENAKPADALQTYKDATLLSSHLHNARKEFTGWNNQGIANFLLGRWDSAIADYNKAGAIARRLGLREKIGITLFNIGNVYQAQNNYPENLRYFELAEPYLNVKQHAMLASNMIDLFDRIGDIKKAREYGYKAIRLSEQVGDSLAWIYSHVNMFSEKHDTLLTKSYAQMKKILPYAIHFKAETQLASIYNNLSVYYYKKARRYDSAIWAANKSEQYMKGIDNAYQGMIDNYILKSKVYLQTKDFDLSEKYGKLALAASTKNPDLIFRLEDIYANLASAEEGRNNPAAALGYYKKYILFKDSVASVRNAELTSQLEARYQNEKKQKEIKELEIYKARQAEDIRFRNFLITLISIVLIAGAIIGLLFYRNTKNKQRLAAQQDDLRLQKITQLEKDKQLIVADAMVKGQEEERTRLAKDLHDGLGGMLWGVKTSLFNMKGNMVLPKEYVVVFERSLGMLDTSIQELRRVAHNLMPEALIKFGLAEALRDFCDFITTANVVHVAFQVVGDTRRVEVSTEVIVYRIANELVNNALRHAAASEIIVQLHFEEDIISLTIEDNGSGFDEKILSATKGSGWPNIRSRTEYLNGRLDVKTALGQGTFVNITIPA